LIVPNSEPLGGDVDGMGDLEDTPMPPMDAGQGMPMDDPNSMPPEEPMGAEDPNAMPGGDPSQDPNAMGGGDDISSKYQQLSPDQQKAADKYVDSMLNTESRGFIKKVIDETFSAILDDTKDGTERPQKKLGNGLKGQLNSPYIPYN